MKKLLLIAALALVFTSCEKKTDYKALGEQFAAQLIELCEKNDTAAVLALNDSISMVEDEVVANGDTAAVNALRKALFDARIKCSPFITIAKMESGMSKDDAVQEVIDNALNGEGNVVAVTAAIKAASEHERKQGKVPEEGKKERPRKRLHGTH